MTAPWDAQQREWLQAMGFDVLTLQAQAAPAVREAPAVQPASQAPTPTAETEIDPAAPLIQALLRAARCDIEAIVVAEVMMIDGGLSRLRADPAAKRALWPRLRALRAKTAAGSADRGATR
ncbi:hypothetical protein ACFFGH_03410 [Lysobacter korlensis]|uniref:Uncharacterized protein n=1 Tax=Lysobacter korlensis TaxID=553636 RepID=A0ABV6RIT4_9GAMM